MSDLGDEDRRDLPAPEEPREEPGREPGRRPRHFRRLLGILAGALVIGCAALLIASHLAAREERALVRLVEDRSRSLAVALGEALRQNFTGLFAPGAAPAEGARAERLDAEVRRILGRTNVIKLAIYAADGLVLYSTDAAEVGTREPHNEGLEAALAGASATAIELEDEVSAFSGVRFDVPVVETYVPLLAESTRGARIGAFEIYADAGAEAAHIRGTFWLVLGELLLVALLLYGCACAALWWLAERREQARRAAAEAARLAIEARSARAEARHKANLLAAVSHEFRTPLNAVIGYSDFMLREPYGPLGDSRYGRYASSIQSSGRHLEALVNDLLDYSSLDAGMFSIAASPLDAAATLREVADTLAPAAWSRSVELALDLPETGLEVLGDEKALRQILLNLACNAVKFSPSGGRVTLGGRRLGAPARLALHVEDSGPGMPESLVRRIGRPFLRVSDPMVANPEGVGLGLAIVSHLVAAHGGELAIDSRRGRGTRVAVTLPSPPARPRSANDQAPPAAPLRAAT